MSFIAQPAANLHSPGPIGDVTPGTVAATSIVVNGNGTADQWLSNVLIFTPWIASRTLGAPILLTEASGADFSRLQLGGATSSYPSIKRNGAGIKIRLADDSADAALGASKLNLSAIPTSSSGLASGDVYSNAGILTIVP